MYATLTLKRLLAILGYPVILIFVLLAVFKGAPKDALAVLRLAAAAIGIYGFVLLICWGLSAWWSPWRLLWQIVPALNRWVFPDLNGTWTGTTSSNWPSIQAMLDTVENKRSDIKRSDLGTIPLKVDSIQIRIRASFFAFVVEARLFATGGTSHSVTERVCYDPKRERFELYYVYVQETPVPAETDEGSHPGAARLVLDMEDWTLRGEYWTKRTWRAGLNTAGLIEVQRVSR
jgi:hypothetical protein